MKEARARLSFFLILLGLVMALTVLIFLPYLVTIATAGTAAVMVRPAHAWIERLLKGKRTVAAFASLLLTIVIVLVPLGLLGFGIAHQAARLYGELAEGDGTPFAQDWLAAAEGKIQQWVPSITIDLGEYVGQALERSVGTLQKLLAGTVDRIIHLLLGVVAYFYLLRDGGQLLKALSRLSPMKGEEDQKILRRLERAINSVVRGSIIIAILQGVATGIGLAIFGVSNAILLAAVAGFSALIPMVGTTLVLVPVVAYLYLQQELFSAIGLTIWGTVAVGLIDTILHPILVGKGMRLHPLFIFFSVIGGVTLFGMAGFIVGPLVVSLLFVLLDIYREEVLEA